jgi:hypothetical protein
LPLIRVWQTADDLVRNFHGLISHTAPKKISLRLVCGSWVPKFRASCYANLRWSTKNDSKISMI